MTKKISVRFICYVLLLGYIPLLLSFSVGYNLKEAGIVSESKGVSTQSFPIDIQDVLKSQKENYVVLMVNNNITSKKWAIVLFRGDGSNYTEGTVIEIKDKLIDWKVNWREYSFADQRFDEFVVGEVEELNSLESLILIILHSGLLGFILYVVSGLTFIFGGLIVVWSLNYLLQQSTSLWNLPAVLCCYSFEFLFFSFISVIHPIAGKPHSSEMLYLFLGSGFIFIFSGIFTIFLWKFEEKPELHQRIKRLYKAFVEGIRDTLE